MINHAKMTLFLGLLASSTATLAQASYLPDELAAFNASNQCNNCDLSGASLSGNHSHAVFSSSNLTGVIARGTFAFAVFPGSNLSSSNWSNSNLSNAQLTYIPLVNTNFSGADLSYANFEGALTNNASFDGANLYGSNITQQQLDSSKSYCWATMPNGTKKNC